MKHKVRPQRGPLEWFSGPWSACSALIVCLVTGAACQDGDGAPDAAGLDWTGDPPLTANGIAPRDGEACEEEGASVPCGKVTERFDDYVTCSEGYRACVGGKWDTCIGTRTTQKPAASGAVGLSLLSLGTPAQCAAGFDVCDPYCNNIIDTPGNFVSGGQVTYDAAKFSNTPSGLTPIATGVGNCTSLAVSVSPDTPLVNGKLTVTSLSPLTTSPTPVKFTLTALPSGCATGTYDTTWAVDRVDRATITGNTSQNGALTLADAIAGTLRVTAFAKGLVSPALIIPVRVNVVLSASTAVTPNTVIASSSDAGLFGTADVPLDGGTTTSTANWLYPYDKTYFPLGLLAPVLQYSYAGTCSNGRSVKVSLRYPKSVTAAASDFNYSLIVKEANNYSRLYATGASSTAPDPQVIIPQGAWQAFERTARDDDAELIVQRLRSTGSTCSSSGPRLENEKRIGIHFVDGQLKGNVYYNSYTSPKGGSIGAVLKVSPNELEPQIAVQPTSNGTSTGTRKCTVCHTLALDGSKLIANTDLTSMITGGVEFNNSRRYNLAVASPNYRNPTVLNTYTNSTGGDFPADSDPRGDRYTYGAPWLNGTHYMTHGGSTAYGGDNNWRAPDDYSKFYRLATTNGSDPTETVITVSGWGTSTRRVSAVTPRFSTDGSKLAFAFWGASTTTLPCSSTAIAPCTTSGTRTLSPDSGGKRLVVVDFKAPVNPSTDTANWMVENARDVTNTVASPHRVAWPSFTPDGNAVAYQRQYRGPLLAWSASTLNTVGGALSEIWLSNVPANGATNAIPTRLLALNGLSSSCSSATTTTCTSTYLPLSSRTVSPVPTNYHNNASMTVYQPDGDCSAGSSASATGVYDYQLNYLPSFNPTEAGGYQWVIFSSRRMYGNVAYGHPWDAEPGKSCEASLNIPSTKKLWIAAVDKTWTPGTDPSHPAFYLPGQELNAGNSNAYWVNAACTAEGYSCSTDDDCCGGTGSSPTTSCKVVSASPLTRECVALSSCSSVGEECVTSSACCTGLVCPDGGGTCLNIPEPIFQTQTMQREYVAECAYGTEVKWRFFEWQADLPTGTSINFSVQTKATATATYQPVAPLTVATASGVSNPTTWYHGAQTTDQALVAAGLFSREYLLVTMTFNPDAIGSAAPTLKGWRQIYDCVPAQ